MGISSTGGTGLAGPHRLVDRSDAVQGEFAASGVDALEAALR
jgi:hypothetical protein